MNKQDLVVAVRGMFTRYMMFLVQTMMVVVVWSGNLMLFSFQWEDRLLYDLCFSIIVYAPAAVIYLLFRAAYTFRHIRPMVYWLST